VHNVPVVHHFVLGIAGKVAPWGWLVEAGANLIVGVIAGAVVLAAVTGFQKMRGKTPAH